MKSSYLLAQAIAGMRNGLPKPASLKLRLQPSGLLMEFERAHRLLNKAESGRLVRSCPKSI